jgi:hypothetical protein
MILASVRSDTQRHLATTQALVQLATADPDHGRANRATVREWIARWTPHADQAARALGALFALDGIASVPFAPQFERVVLRQRAIVTELGLQAGRS